MKLKDFNLTVGDCIFTYNGSWLNRKILWFSKYKTPKNRVEKIAHVAMYIGDKNGVPQIFEADWKGMKVNSGSSLNNKKYDIHVSSPKDIVIDDYHMAKLNLYIKNCKDMPYAYSQLVGIAIKKILGLHKIGDWDKDAMICSELYCEALKYVWSIKITDNPEGITPLDIYYSKNMIHKDPKK